MSEWKVYRLSDFIEINPKVTLKSGLKHSFVEMKDLSESQKFVLPSQLKEIKGGARFQNFDTLFARITPCLQNGKICQVKGLINSTGFGSTEFLVFRGKEGISNTDFVYYLSKYDVVRKFAEQNMIGTSGRQRVSKDSFDNIELFLPDLQTQTAIAETLSSLDDKIELNNKINQELETLAQTLFKQWFIDFEFPNENGEPYKSSGGEMVESELGEIPMYWSVEKLKNKIENVKSIPKTGTNLHNRKYVPIDKMAIKSLVTNNFSPIDEAKSSLIFFEKGDILLGAMRVYFHRVNYCMFDGITRTTCFVLRPYLKSEVSFFLLYLNQNDTIEYANRTSKGTTMPYAVWEDGLAELKFVYPTSEISSSFDKIISELVNQISINIKENIELTNLRNILLPKLITGEIEINN
jgi:type I restriction enzyme S subunit